MIPTASSLSLSLISKCSAYHRVCAVNFVARRRALAFREGGSCKSSCRCCQSMLCTNRSDRRLVPVHDFATRSTNALNDFGWSTNCSTGIQIEEVHLLLRQPFQNFVKYAQLANDSARLSYFGSLCARSKMRSHFRSMTLNIGRRRQWHIY